VPEGPSFYVCESDQDETTKPDKYVIITHEGILPAPNAYTPLCDRQKENITNNTSRYMLPLLRAMMVVAIRRNEQNAGASYPKRDGNCRAEVIFRFYFFCSCSLLSSVDSLQRTQTLHSHFDFFLPSLFFIFVCLDPSFYRICMLISRYSHHGRQFFHPTQQCRPF
jgi:hypothetical protein